MNIKRLIKGCVLVILVLLVGCSNDTELTSEERAHKVIELLQTGDIETIHKQWFSEELQETISLNELKSEWDKTGYEKGEFVGVHSLESESRGEDLEVTEGKVEYENVIFDIRMIFNENQSLVGFSLPNAVSNGKIPDTIMEEEVLVGEGKEYELEGILTLPKENQKNLPAVVLVQGSGASDRDEAVYSYKPFRDIAWKLAEQGIATIRYDKRNFVHGQKMAQNIDNLTVYEETIEDAIYATELLKSDERINQDNVYIIGHSLGGMLAPRIDVQGGEYAGLIILGGSARALWEISYDQNQDAIEMQVRDENEKKNRKEKVEKEYEKALGLKDVTLEESKNMTVFGLNGYYIKEMEQYDTRALVQDLEKPILVLQGEEDIQVSYEKDFALFKELLYNKENATLISYENLNHFFIVSQGPGKGTVAEYKYPDKVSEEVIEDISNWILDK